MSAGMFAAIVVAGGMGAAARFIIDGWIQQRLPFLVPLGTLFVNVSGSLLLGFLTGITSGGSGGAELRAVLGTGFLGGYTTFSTASVQQADLAESGHPLLAGLDASVMLAGSLVAGGLGLLVGRALI